MELAPRRDLYRLLGGLLQRPPEDNLLAALAAQGALQVLAEHAPDGPIRSGLMRMQDDANAGAPAWQAVRADFMSLFLGPRKKQAPPWASVFLSPDRLVMQEEAAAVVRAYAEQQVGFEGMGEIPADHIGLELEFVAVLLDRGSRVQASLRAFLERHVLRWVPAFAQAVRASAKTPFFVGLADVLTGLCEWEAAHVSDARPALND